MRAEKYFQKYGVWTVFFGRFVALLRIFAGPMAGMLRMHYPRFLAANAAGGIAWATTIGIVAYKIGDNADKIFGRLSIWALVVRRWARSRRTRLQVRRRGRAYRRATAGRVSGRLAAGSE